MIVEDGQRCSTGKRGPVGAFEGNILVIIEYRDAEHIGLKLTHGSHLCKAAVEA